MPLPIYDTSANRAAPLGSEYTQGMDRVFRYAKNGPGALAVGAVLKAAPPNDSHANMTCGAVAAGRTAITVTLAQGDPMDRDEYKEGNIYINDQAGEGYLYTVLSHEGGGGEDTTKVINIRDHTVVALTTSSQATLTKNIYYNVGKLFGDPGEIIVGVAPCGIPSNHYFWCQVRGPAVVLQDGALFAGRGVMYSRDKPGAVTVAKQVVPVVADRRTTMLMDSTPTLAAEASPPVQYTQKAVVDRPKGGAKQEDPELLSEVSGKATIPERIIGYCINPRVSTEHALIYLTLS